MTHVERTGFNTARSLMNKIVQQLTGYGNSGENEIVTPYFEFLSYVNYSAFETASNSGTNHVVLRPTSNIDPMITGTEVWTWGLTLFLDSGQLKASWGVMKFDGTSGGEINNVSGISGAINGDPGAVSGGSEGGCIAELSAGSNSTLNTSIPNNSNLHGFGLKVTDHGFGIVIYHQTKVTNWKQFGVLVIQRPVKNDGTTLVKVDATDKAPLFAIWNNLDYGDGIDDPLWYKSVIMEDDKSYSTSTLITKHVNRPTGSGSFYDINDRYRNPDKYSLIDVESEHTLYRLPTFWELPLTQDNKEVPLVFPFGLTTKRHVYMENIDIICVGPSSVFTFGQDIEINVFGTPGEQREYRVYSASTDCKGVVVALLKDIL